jgi:hypothetical protein
MQSLTQKRDDLIKQLADQSGFISVGIAKKNGQLVLLVAVDPTFHGQVPENFEGVGVVVEDLGQAESQISPRENVSGY